MKKKLFSLLLALAICAAAALPAFAAETEPAKSVSGVEKLELAAAKLVDDLTPYVEKATVVTKDGATLTSLLLQVYDKAGVTALTLPEAVRITPKRAAAQTEEAGSRNEITGGKYSVAELTRLIRKYMFIRIEDPAEAAALIAETTEFSYELVNGSDGTLYMRVNVEDNPQIFNYDVFRALVEQLYARQNEEMQKDEYGKIDYVMSYEHIAGELALHTIAFAATNLILDVTNSRDEKLLSLYKSASYANLNADEARIPGGAIRFLGTLIINVFKFNVLKLFSFLA